MWRPHGKGRRGEGVKIIEPKLARIVSIRLPSRPIIINNMFILKRFHGKLDKVGRGSYFRGICNVCSLPYPPEFSGTDQQGQ